MKQGYANLKRIFVVMLLFLGGFSSNVNAQGYIYVHKKAMDESEDVNFTFNITKGATPVSAFQLNDNAANVQIKDLGAAQNGGLWAVDKTNKLYYRNSTSSAWIYTNISNASRVDGGPLDICYYATTGGNVFTYDGTTNINTQIYSGTDAIDVASTWSGQPFMIAGTANTIYRFNGNLLNITLSGWTAYNSTAAGTGYSQIDGNPVNGNIYGRSTTNENVYMIPSGSGSATSLGRPAGTVVTTKEDIGIASDGSIYGIWQFSGGGNWYVYKWTGGTTWSVPELQSRYADVVTGGVGGQVWADNAFFLAVPAPYSNIITRAVSGSTISWLDDERVRTGPTASNSYMIAVAPGTYTVTETPASGWDLKAIDIYDPTNNTTANVSANSTTVDVIDGEVVNLVYQNVYIKTSAVSNTCGSVNYFQTFGSGTAAYESPIPGLTSMHYIAGTKFPDGYYSLEKSSASWPDNSILTDHTPDIIDGNPDGYFMTINASYAPDEFYRQRVSGLLTTIPYTLSFYAANLSPLAAIKPNITFGTRDVTTGNVIGSIITGNITASGWTQYTYTFIPTSSTVDLFIGNNSAGGDGNDLALDDITFSVEKPSVPISTVISAGCGTLGSITVTSPVSSIYEYSIDGTNFITFPNTTFSNLAAGPYTVSARFAGSHGCITTKTETIGVTICGNVWDDANGNAINNSETTPIPSGSNGVWVNLVDATGVVLQSVPVDASGNYSLSGLTPNTNYKIILSNVDQTGNNLISVTKATLPAGYTATGTNLSGIANSANSTGIVTINTGTGGLTNQNFGIEKLPLSVSLSTTIASPALNSFLTLDGIGGRPPVLQGSDAEDMPATGSLNAKKVAITSLPANGELWYNNVKIAFGADGINPPSVSNPFVITGYDPSLLQVKFTGSSSGYTSTSFNYAYIDAAGKQSATPATYQLNWLKVLPIVLESFTATKENDKVRLLWKSSSELNVSKFIVEFSIDGSIFNAIANITATGNSSIPVNYSWLHNNPVTGNNYYRLKMVDLDGRFTYSIINIVKMNNNGDAVISVYPNPVHNVLNILLSKTATAETVINIYGNDGKLLLNKATGKTQTIQLSVSSWASGIYYIRLVENGMPLYDVKFVKQ